MILRVSALCACLWPGVLMAGDMRLELPLSDAAGWRYISDQVMGGVSDGRASLSGEVLRLQGDVSTQNRGGFIQARLKLDEPVPAGAAGVVLRTQGNGQTYFVHLRTGGTVLPWQYYQAPFEAGDDWQEVRLPFEAFKPSGRGLSGVPKAQSIQSLAIVAYGRDHQADVRVKSVGFY